MATAAWIAALGVLLAPPASREEVLEQARTLWDDGQIQAVATLFEHSYALDPQPEYLFGRAHAEARLGDCETAMELLDAFLATNPPEAQADAAKEELSECAPEPAPAVPEPTTEPVAPPPPTELRIEPTEPRDPVVDRSRPRPDALGWTLVATGAVALAAGTGMFFAGRARIANPTDTMNEQDYRSTTTRSQRLGWAGLGVGGAGVGLLTGGIVRLVLQRRK